MLQIFSNVPLTFLYTAMNVLKDQYSLYATAILLQRRALGSDLSDEAHEAIEQILKERGEILSPRASTPLWYGPKERPLMLLAKTLTQQLVAFLFAPSLPLWKYCAIAVPLALIPSLVMVGAAMFTLQLVGITPRMPVHPPMSNPFWVVIMVLVSPAAETVLLAVGLWLLKRLTAKPIRLAAASATLWGLLHGTVAPIWFFGTVWSFFIFSSAYLAWRPRSRALAFTAAAVPHALGNLVSVAMMRLST